MRTLVALGLFSHGFIHLIGFVTPWRIAVLEGFSYRTSVLGGAHDVGDFGVRLIGLVWLGLAVGFATAAHGVWRGEPWARSLAGVLAIVSLVVCTLGLPETFAGIAINVGILGAVVYVGILRPRRPA